MEKKENKSQIKSKYHELLDYIQKKREFNKGFREYQKKRYEFVHAHDSLFNELGKKARRGEWPAEKDRVNKPYIKASFDPWDRLFPLKKEYMVGPKKENSER